MSAVGADEASPTTAHERGRSLHERLRAFRRDMHRHPEIGLHLPRTQGKVIEALRSLHGLEVSVGTQCSSVTAVLRGGGEADTSRPVVVLRADMDGLPVQEECDLTYASTVPGAMHACGHDLHTAMLLGAAELLTERAQDLPVDVVFMFQPGEEGYGGARVMVEEGVLDAAGRRADAAFGLHVFSAGMEHGVFSSRAGALMSASDVRHVTMIGAGGHGSTPHQAKDPIPAACSAVLALQTMVTRETDIFDPVVVTVGSIHAGTAANVIPEQARFDVSVRTYSPAARRHILERIDTLVHHIAFAHGLDASVTADDGYPVTRTDPDAHRYALETVGDLLGQDRVAERAHPMPGSEDFSFVLDEVPGAFLLLGAGTPGSNPNTAALNHSPHAEFDDSVLFDGARALAALAARYPRAREDGPLTTARKEG